MHDPYRRCEEVCTHDLARGALLEELLQEDGPYPDVLTERWFDIWRNTPRAPSVADTDDERTDDD